MNRFWVNCVFTLAGFAAAVEVSTAAQIPSVAGNVSSKGFTRIDFCSADGLLYAFNGLDLYRYNSVSDSFEVAFTGAGSVIGDTWDPADFAFLTDCNNAVLPTGQSQRVVYVDRQLGLAQERSGLRRNYFSTACRYRDNQIFANGVDTICNNTIYLLDMDSNGTETRLAQVSNNNSGAIAFDFADNLYLADFKPLPDSNKLGKVDIYRISRSQLDVFVEDSNCIVLAELLVNDVILAGSDSMVIDANYNIYVSSYVGVAKIIPTNEPNDFNVTAVDGDIYANPIGFPWPHFRFCGITADIKTGTIYYGKSELNEQYQYDPYILQSVLTAAASDWSADLDGDGIVNFYDLYLLQEDYLSSEGYLKGDLNDDDFVNFRDFVIFARQWQNKSPWYKEN